MLSEKQWFPVFKEIESKTRCKPLAQTEVCFAYTDEIVSGV